MKLYDNVKYLAVKQGISLPDLSEKIGLARTAIYKWDKQTPNVETIEKLAKYFDVSIEFLIGSNHIPEWTSDNDVFDLNTLLEGTSRIHYNGKELSASEKERAKEILSILFTK